MIESLGGHRHKALVVGRVRLERHFSSGKAPDPPAPGPAPQATDPEVERERRNTRQALARRRGRRATITTSAANLAEEPATTRGSLTAAGSVSRLGG